jgi:hypothetical protein
MLGCCVSSTSTTNRDRGDGSKAAAEAVEPQQRFFGVLGGGQRRPEAQRWLSGEDKFEAIRSRWKKVTRIELEETNKLDGGRFTATQELKVGIDVGSIGRT